MFQGLKMIPTWADSDSYGYGVSYGDGFANGSGYGLSVDSEEFVIFSQEEKLNEAEQS